MEAIAATLTNLLKKAADMDQLPTWTIDAGHV
jgi:hypothetical protein